MDSAWIATNQPLMYLNRKSLNVFDRVAIFDRDGTLSHDSGYESDPNKLSLLPGVVETVEFLKLNLIEFAVVTNQSGIARGKFTKEEMEWFNLKLSERLLDRSRYTFSYLLACPHSPHDRCICRKPSGYMLREVKSNLPNAQYCFFGDKQTDIEAAVDAGIESALVSPGDLLTKVKEWFES
jgi:D-glycero-D-manno-heptose 1,7-bisphosphate phosphatase